MVEISCWALPQGRALATKGVLPFRGLLVAVLPELPLTLVRSVPSGNRSSPWIFGPGGT